MSADLNNFADTLRTIMAGEAESLASMIHNLRVLSQELRAGGSDEKAAAIARADDPVPTAALLLRVSRKWREAAAATEEFRGALIVAVGRARRTAEGEEEA